MSLNMDIYWVNMSILDGQNKWKMSHTEKNRVFPEPSKLAGTSEQRPCPPLIGREEFNATTPCRYSIYFKTERSGVC